MRFPLLGKTAPRESAAGRRCTSTPSRRDEGILAANGPLVVRTGRHTGRSPKDKYLVDEPDAHAGVWWGGFNHPISEERYDRRCGRASSTHMNQREVFVQRRLSSAPIRAIAAPCAPTPRRPGRASSATTFSSARAARDLADFEPNFTIIDAPTFRADPERDGTRSETVILVTWPSQEILIGGTEYAGEIKKGAFGIMNYRLPAEGVLPMHSSVNVGARTATWPSSSACRAPARRPFRRTRSAS